MLLVAIVDVVAAHRQVQVVLDPSVELVEFQLLIVFRLFKHLLRVDIMHKVN